MTTGPVGPDSERERRRRIAMELAVAHGPKILERFRQGELAVLGRMSPEERALMVHDWPIARRVVALAVPEILEGFLDVLADGFSPWLLEQIRERCVKSTEDSSSSMSSAAG